MRPLSSIVKLKLKSDNPATVPSEGITLTPTEMDTGEAQLDASFHGTRKKRAAPNVIVSPSLACRQRTDSPLFVPEDLE